MRDLIKFSGGLFVVIGFLAFLAGCALAASAMGSYDTGSGLLIGLASIGIGASIVLVGGSTFMLCSIDERLAGTSVRTAGQSTPSDTMTNSQAFAARTGNAYVLLESTNGVLPYGWYKATDDENVPMFYYHGGPKFEALSRTDFTDVPDLPDTRTEQVPHGFYRNSHGAYVYHIGGFVPTILRSIT